MIKKFLFFFLLSLSGLAFAGEVICNFGRGQWNPEEWQLVKSPRWSYTGSWVQQDDSIVNRCPEDASADEMLGKRAPETYTSMVRKQALQGNATISSTMSFSYQMAPEIVIAGELGADSSQYPEYREHWEIVLYNQGLNVWHHEIKAGKPYWRKAAFLEANLEPGKKYTLTADIQFTYKVPMLTVTCGDLKFGCMLPTLPKDYYVGITGCEGYCNFYDFKIVTK